MKNIYIIQNDFLMHHGIKGQKWGDRNGPPYPLNPQKDYSSAEKKASSEGDLSDYSLTASLIKSAVRSSYANKYLKERYNEETDKKTGFKLKSREMTKREDLYRVNPDYGTKNESGSTNNCVICSLAYEFRRRGYDVRAGKTAHGFDGSKMAEKLYNAKPAKEIPGQETSNSALRWTRMKYGGNKTAYADTVKELSKYKNTHGQMLVRWTPRSGHSFIYDVDENGKVTFMDAQVAKIYSEREAKKLFNSTVSSRYQRLDNANGLDVKFAKEIFR